MTYSSLRTVSALALAALLTACGAGQQDVQAPASLATVVSSSASNRDAGPTASASSAAAAPAASAPVASVASANMPVADCEPEGCSSLRIIDGNAEAYRIDAQRRASEGDLANT
ncbi:hypothetical protein [Massilia niastensis]|uniref:hypothetical protein n=1 Tax=Massilia niastensis TaxID=544911 RepID=UPI0003748354|nr:hypothetical protein [Massilia niastensis]